MDQEPHSEYTRKITYYSQTFWQWVIYLAIAIAMSVGLAIMWPVLTLWWLVVATLALGVHLIFGVTAFASLVTAWLSIILIVTFFFIYVTHAMRRENPFAVRYMDR